MSAPLLELEGVGVRYAASGDAGWALEEASLRLEPGQAVGLLGESGAGKSSLARVIPGLLPPTARTRGSVRLQGRELLGLGERELRPLRGAVVASLFQEPSLSLAPLRRVGDQVGDVLAAHLGLSRAARRARVLELLARVGLQPEHARAWPFQLSGGERQRAALARAVAAGPRLLIADEPSAGLDPVARRELVALLAELRSGFALALLLVSHDFETLAALCDRVLVLYAGRVVEEAAPAALRAAPAHPYTRGLLAALPPPPGSGRERPRAIPGSAPGPGARPAGCCFEPRCAERLEHCASRPPPRVSLGGGQRVRCFLHAADA